MQSPGNGIGRGSGDENSFYDSFNNLNQPTKHLQNQQQQHQHRKSADLTLRRRQNRDAAARHRQRQNNKLDHLAHKEAVLSQQVSEMQLEIELLRNSQAGLTLPTRDPFTACIKAMLDQLQNLASSLTQNKDRNGDGEGGQRLLHKDQR
ncbi:hypothetical protein BX661DRAFT_174606 [Kickxella alabastrina]|uniref:uncharacterized protein n=1 Tax=Kickxella alabastrina TaxID=61397 RepID=UPI0022202558|nr:uncharacterized protein BX661DRAFT_174606 [Kickxella alabastrina]KAI7818117.1 hypothetical protein BX661DRAFT_174606 [Kickxella alabastrina]